MRNVSILFSCLLLIGCAAGNKYNYRAELTSLPLKSTTEQLLLLDLDDRRPYILSGEKNPDFVGLQRGGFGNPFEVTTASGKPMIDDMASSVAASLEKSGYSVKIAEGNTDLSQLIILARSHDIFRIIRLQVFEWKSDIYMSIGLHYDLQLSIYDAEGNLLAENSMKGNEAVGGGKISATQNSEHMADEFGKRIGYLFNNPQIRDAMSVNRNGE
jgi:hypothetical protein